MEHSLFYDWKHHLQPLWCKWINYRVFCIAAPVFAPGLLIRLKIMKFQFCQNLSFRISYFSFWFFFFCITVFSPKYEFEFSSEGTQCFIHCLFKVASLATINKQMMSSLATYEALSLVITKPSYIYLVWLSECWHKYTLRK